MERVHPSPPPPPPPLYPSPKMARRIIEKNRRDHMKGLYSNLHSLLPSYKSKENLPVPEQVDEAVKYIKSLQIRIEKNNLKKENLLSQKRPRSCVASEKNVENNTSRLPQFEIHEVGPAMDVILISGLEKHATFYSILRWLDEEGFEVVNASFSSSGNSMFQVAYAKVGKSTIGIRATTVGRLKELIHGHPQGDLESSLDLCDFDIWDSGILDIMPMLETGEFSNILNRV